MEFGYAFLFTYLALLVLFGGFYAWAYLKKSYNTVDIAYGAAFPLAADMQQKKSYRLRNRFFYTRVPLLNRAAILLSHPVHG